MRVIADETARASYDMLENLVYRASRLSLASRSGSTKAAKQGSSRRGSSVVISAGRNRSSSSEGYSDTRYHSTEKHLRKDQRWRYEYLYKIDPCTKARIPQVRRRDGKLLTPFQLALELPKFRDAELIDIGEKLPFYDEYMAGADHMSSSSENRARVQISVLGRFLPSYGDIDVLCNFWRDNGVVVNHQSLFTDFNWTKERLTVSPLLISVVTDHTKS